MLAATRDWPESQEPERAAANPPQRTGGAEAPCACLDVARQREQTAFQGKQEREV
jgi:hypothetical protein